MKTHKIGMENKIDGEWVQVAYAGTFVHPLTREKFSLSVDTFKEWERYFRYVTEQGNSVPLTKNHSVDPTDRLGSITDVQIRDNDFWIKIQYADEENHQKLSQSSFSILAVKNFQMSDGSTWEDCFHHVGVTDYPVIRGLQREIAASICVPENIFANEVGDRDISNGSSGEETKTVERKDMKNIALALGLPEDASEEAILAEIRKPKVDPNTDKLLDLLVKDRENKINALSIAEDRKTELKKFATKETLLLELSVGSSLFDTAYSSIASVTPASPGFKTGTQNPATGGETTPLSLVDTMKKLKEAN